MDDAELWVLASQLGANRGSESGLLEDEEGFTWNQRRAIALERGQPEPSWDDAPVSAAERAGVLRLMGGAQALLPPGYEGEVSSG